jgi:hypothetical protein
VVWGHLILAIRKSDYLPRKQEFYDERGRLQKVLKFEDIRSVGDRNYPMRWRMTTVTKEQRETVLIYQSLRFDRPIASRIFTQQHLKRRL